MYIRCFLLANAFELTSFRLFHKRKLLSQTIIHIVLKTLVKCFLKIGAQCKNYFDLQRDEDEDDDDDDVPVDILNDGT